MPSLFRYFSPEHAEAFVQRGEVLFRALSYFRDYEDDGVRSDEYEGTLVHLPKDGLKLTLVETGGVVAVPYTMESTAKEDDIFIYCMSTERSAHLSSRFNAPVCVEILDMPKFLSCLRGALPMRACIEDKTLVHDIVNYYEHHELPIVDWALPERIALRKPKSFNWQKEYRFAFARNGAFAVENVSLKLVPIGERRLLRSTSHPNMLLKLGSLSKICKVHST